MIGIGILGYGAIGAGVIDALVSGRVPGAHLVAVARRRPDPVEQPTVIQVTAPDGWSQVDVGLVLEAAGAEALAAHGPAILSAGRDLMVMSAAALLEGELLEQLSAAAQAGGSRLLVPGGAISGLDVVRAAATAGTLRRVQLRSVKPPAGWAGNPYLEARGFDPARVEEPVCVFVGTARMAARHFPKNVNIAAALALAGLGPDETLVELWADPATRDTTHRVTVEADCYQMTTELVSQTSPSNPRTSVVAMEQALGALAAYTAALRVG